MLLDTILRVLNDRWVRIIVLLVVLLTLANQLSILFWRLYPTVKTEFIIPGEILRKENSDAQRKGALGQSQVIGRAYLFGKPQAVLVPIVEFAEVPETRLNYKLRGIYYSEVARLSSAIIEIKPNDSKLYRLDDELGDKISLVGIKLDHILINRYGKIERLNLAKPAGIGGNPLIDTRLVGPDAIASTALLRSYKKRYVSNPMALARRFQAIPVQKNGRNIGFKLKALRGESLLKRLNFRETDVFIKVNGIGLDKPFQALDALKSLTTAPSVSVTILRNGNEQTLNFGL